MRKIEIPILPSQHEKEGMFMAKKKAAKRKSAAKRRPAAKRKSTAKRRPAARKKTAARRKPAAKKKSGAKRKSGLSQMTYTLSPELQSVVGTKSATRPQVVKKLWVYIKAHKCQDTKNRRMIVPDSKLSAVIGNRPVDMLKLAGLLSKHIK
jgi:upstream activation factor subunit UAF30